MRKLIMFNMVTLDGYFEGVKKWDIDWHQVDQEFNIFAIEQLQHAGGLIFGRITYEGMASYWPSPKAVEDDPIVASLMNSIPKFVFSNTLISADWKNTQVIRGDAVEGMIRLKQQPGKDLFIFGSADLCSTFTRNCLIDEYRLMVNPIVLGDGVPLFKKTSEPIKLNLIKSRAFKNGNSLLTYTYDETKQMEKSSDEQ